MVKDNILSLYGIKDEVRYNCRADKKQKKILEVGATSINFPKELFYTACALEGAKHIKTREDAMKILKMTLSLNTMEEIISFLKGKKEKV